MTREEAEEYAKEMTFHDAIYNALQGKCIPYRKATLIKLYELLDKLEQEPFEDAISRQAAIDAIDNMVRRKFGIGCDLGEITLENLPSVSTEKTGHWIEQDGYDGDTYYDCSECGESFCLIDGTPTDNLYNYCPNCGAKMEVEE